jgi:hypothetical protein
MVRRPRREWRPISADGGHEPTCRRARALDTLPRGLEVEAPEQPSGRCIDLNLRVAPRCLGALGLTRAVRGAEKRRGGGRGAAKGYSSLQASVGTHVCSTVLRGLAPGAKKKPGAGFLPRPGFASPGRRRGLETARSMRCVVAGCEDGCHGRGRSGSRRRSAICRLSVFEQQLRSPR